MSREILKLIEGGILVAMLITVEPSLPAQAQQAPPAYFETDATYESVYVNTRQGYLYVQYCAGTAYGPFGDAKCEIQSPGPPKFLPAYHRSSATGGLSTNTAGLGPGDLLASVSFGPNTVNGTFKGAYNWVGAGLSVDSYSMYLSETIRIFVRGGPGTKFHLDYSMAEAAQASVSQADCVSGGISAGFSSPAGVGASAGNAGDAVAHNATASPPGGIDGVTGSDSRTYLGATYTLA